MSEGGKTPQVRPVIPGFPWGSRRPWEVRQVSLYGRSGELGCSSCLPLMAVWPKHASTLRVRGLCLFLFSQQRAPRVVPVGFASVFGWGGGWLLFYSADSHLPLLTSWVKISRDGAWKCVLLTCLWVNSDSQLWELGTLWAKHLRPRFCGLLTGLSSGLTQSWLLELVSIPDRCLGALCGACWLVFLQDTTPSVDSSKCSNGERSSIYKTASRAKERAEWGLEEQRLGSVGVPLWEGDLLCRGRNEHEALSLTPQVHGSLGTQSGLSPERSFPWSINSLLSVSTKSLRSGPRLKTELETSSVVAAEIVLKILLTFLWPQHL